MGRKRMRMDAAMTPLAVANKLVNNAATPLINNKLFLIVIGSNNNNEIIMIKFNIII
jgi:hypothetical protein